jgi:hypothetical protein
VAIYKTIVVETATEFEVPEGWVFVHATIESFHTRVLIRKEDEER